jgi:hypothetical protein
MRALGISLVCFLLMAGCAPTNGRYGLRPPTNSAQTAAQTNSAQAQGSQHCPDRLNRTRAGGTVGSVVGFVAASALGSPLLGILYQVAGYGAGFASADNCRKETATVARATAQAPSAAPVASPAKIAEEDIN